MQIKQWCDKLSASTYKEISPLELGMTQTDVVALFGTPDAISSQTPSTIFKYADVELHFEKQDNSRLFLVCINADKVLSIQFEPVLYDQLSDICKNLTDDNQVYCHLFQKGHALLSSYKSAGGTQGSAFHTVKRLYMDNRQIGGELEEYREDLIGDWLDCMCSWIGNKDLILW